MFEVLFTVGRHPSFFRLFALGLFASLISPFLGFWLFGEYGSVAMIFLTSFMLIPYMYALIVKEEKITEHITSEKYFIREYGHILVGLVGIFFGVMVGYFLIYILVPSSFHDIFFKVQQEELFAISGRITMNGDLFSIIINNFYVLLIAAFLSIFYGFGAINLIVWNAALVSVAMGQLFLGNVAQTGVVGGVFTSFIRYLIHGIPEILAYFIGGLAGGILAIAIIKHKFHTKEWWNVVQYASQMFLIAIGLIVLAGLLEVFVTPLVMLLF